MFGFLSFFFTAVAVEMEISKKIFMRQKKKFKRKFFYSISNDDNENDNEFVGWLNITVSGIAVIELIGMQSHVLTCSKYYFEFCMRWKI